jgi:hypothetical protein
VAFSLRVADNILTSTLFAVLELSSLSIARIWIAYSTHSRKSEIHWLGECVLS